MVIDCFDYAELIEVEQTKNGNWILAKNDDISFTFYKYPLNIKRYPIMTFGIKIHGVPNKKLVDEIQMEKVTSFFDKVGNFKIRDVKNEAKLEVTIKTGDIFDLEKLYLFTLEGPSVVFKCKILDKGETKFSLRFNCNPNVYYKCSLESLLCKSDSSGWKIRAHH